MAKKYMMFLRSGGFTLEEITLETLKSFSDVDENDCWIWQGGRVSAGYGTYYNYKNESRYVHRLSAELAYGSAPDGYMALHSCDVKPCCNPDHLRWGTAKENVREMHDRGLARTGPPRRGLNNPASKLTPNDVIEMHLLNSFGWSRFELADLYNVSYQSVRNVLIGKNWKVLY